MLTNEQINEKLKEINGDLDTIKLYSSIKKFSQLDTPLGAASKEYTYLNLMSKVSDNLSELSKELTTQLNNLPDGDSDRLKSLIKTVDRLNRVQERACSNILHLDTNPMVRGKKNNLDKFTQLQKKEAEQVIQEYTSIAAKISDFFKSIANLFGAKKELNSEKLNSKLEELAKVGDKLNSTFDKLKENKKQLSSLDNKLSDKAEIAKLGTDDTKEIALRAKIIEKANEKTKKTGKNKKSVEYIYKVQGTEKNSRGY
ncbi:MAG: hypothetical protein J0H68_03470 [Sphingobacteriia bacterium]|nr:hypothetical protein [Sphingobacteriia bacterium]